MCERITIFIPPLLILLVSSKCGDDDGCDPDFSPSTASSSDEESDNEERRTRENIQPADPNQAIIAKVGSIQLLLDAVSQVTKQMKQPSCTSW